MLHTVLQDVVGGHGVVCAGLLDAGLKDGQKVGFHLADAGVQRCTVGAALGNAVTDVMLRLAGDGGVACHVAVVLLARDDGVNILIRLPAGHAGGVFPDTSAVAQPGASVGQPVFLWLG